MPAKRSVISEKSMESDDVTGFPFSLIVAPFLCSSLLLTLRRCLLGEGKVGDDDDNDDDDDKDKLR